jgi:phosphoglycerol transferase MdoB-like AlkP superfamily enzyme
LLQFLTFAANNNKMYRIYASLLRQFIFWLLFFAVNRVIFLLYYRHLLLVSGAGNAEIMASFRHALRLDVSTACYILLLPFFLLSLRIFLNSRWIDWANKIYTAFIILAYNLITTAELGIYGEWKTKLPYKALHYLTNPGEVYGSASTLEFIVLLLVFLLISCLSFLFYIRFIYRKPLVGKKYFPAAFAFYVLMPALLFLGIRGGIQAIPITQSQSYYSQHHILNHAAVNSGYQFAFSTLENYRFMHRNPYDFYDDDVARAIVRDINYTVKDTTINILRISRPNIVIILLESWSADLVHSLNGEAGITPEFEKLIGQGILFDSFYASGNRSEQAMSSIFGGFPATPITAITHNLDKVTKLPSMIELLKDAGYYTSFYFGGHLMYGGIKSYLRIAGFEKMMEIYDYPRSIPRGKLGIHDEYILNHHLGEMENMPQPFLSVVFTLSSHSPYDQPMENVLDWGGSENNYINSAYYSDRSLGEYFEKASQAAWYDSTLFIILADHSHNSYRHWPVHSPNYRHIPLLLYGNAIRPEFRGSRVSRLSSQPDIPLTLLKQLDIDTELFTWSRDLFNPYSPEFVFYETNNGLGWIRPYGYFVWDKSIGFINLEAPENRKDSLVREGKAYLQVLFRDFIDY